MSIYRPPRRRHSALNSHRSTRFGNTMRSAQSRIRSRAREMLAGFVEHDQRHRLLAMMFIVSTVIVLYITRLFYLQVLNGEAYFSMAQEQQYGKIVIPAKRGEILIENPKTGELNKFATNTTLDLVYIDPQETPDKARVAKELAPLLFDEEDFFACKEDFKLCPSGGVQFDASQILVNGKEDTKAELQLKDTRTKEQLIAAYEKDLLEKISKEEIDYVPLRYGATEEEMLGVEDLGILGVEVVKNKNLIYLDPTRIDQKQLKVLAKKLDAVLSDGEDYFAKLLIRRSVRYIPLKRRLTPETSEAIWKLKTESYKEYKQDTDNIPHYFKGVVLIPEHWRYYPEKELASTVIGYTDHEGFGRYGIEEQFDVQLRGQQGEMLSKTDVDGVQVSFDPSQLVEAQDGDSIILTIDRVIQSKVQELLKSAVESYSADSGTIIVANPFNGHILAMGNYPNFDPNNFGDVYQLKATETSEWKDFGTPIYKGDIYQTQPFFIKDEKGDYQEIRYGAIMKEKEDIQIAKDRIKRGEKDVDEEGNEHEIIVPEEVQKYVYKNHFGLAAYVNKAVMSLYEPGSVFKPIAMAIGLDAGEVTPTETYEEFGPIKIDTGIGTFQYIRTALNKYRGIQTMTNALEQSSNIGMAYVARKLGRELFYDYIQQFGFGDYTYISLVGEQKGSLEYWKKWTEAKLLTSSFGQGISVTPIQMIQAWMALANGGIIIQPQIVKAILPHGGEAEEVETTVVRRVISEEAAQKISAMLVSSVDHGVALPGKVAGYHIAGKTGTSQIACADNTRCKNGTYEKGEGTTVTSFAGYAPIEKPKFVVLVKFERPRIGDNTWGSTTAAPVFKDLMQFLLQYYDVAPDE